MKLLRSLFAPPLVLLLVASCSGEPESPAPPDEGPQGEAAEELSTQGIERLIPVRIVQMSRCTAGKCSRPCTDSPHTAADESAQNCDPYLLPGMTEEASYQAILTQIEAVNEVFRPAGVQFYVRSVDLYPMPNMANGENLGGDADWSAARQELGMVFPLETTAWSAGTTRTWAAWMYHVSAYYADPTEVAMLLPVVSTDAADGSGTPSGLGAYPSEGRFVYLPPYFFTDFENNVAHEVGHFFGLPHSFGHTAPFCSGAAWCDTTGARLAVGSSPEIVDPRTNAPITSLAYFWDLAYGLPAGGGAPVTFESEADALAYGGTLETKNVKIHSLCPGSGNFCDTMNCSVNAARTAATCTIEGTTYYTGHPMMEGLAFVGESGLHTGNVMSYDFGVYDDDPNAMLSASQIRHVRRALRYEITNRTIAATQRPTGGKYSGQTARGGRPQLGQGMQRPLKMDMDFDADGRRDMAYWTVDPATQLGYFHVRLWRHGFAPAREYVMRLGAVGDTPLPMKMDAGATTDLVVITRNNRLASGAFDPYDDDVIWLYRPCSYDAATDTLACTKPLFGEGFTASHLGRTKDVFFPELEIDGDPDTRETLIFRPETSTYYWCTPFSSSIPCNNPASKQVGPTTPPPEYPRIVNVPLPGLYDADTKTDLVTYSVPAAKFTMQMSTGSPIYSSAPSTLSWGQCPHAPGWGGFGCSSGAVDRSGSVPVQGLAHTVSGKVRSALALWQPEEADWYVDWPDTFAGSPSGCAFGSRDAVPLLGGVDRNGDGRSDFLMFDPGTTDGTGASLRMKNADSGACAGTSVKRTFSWLHERSIVYPVGDMTGEGVPEIVVIDPASMVWRVLSSTSDYATVIHTLTGFGDNASAPL